MHKTPNTPTTTIKIRHQTSSHTNIVSCVQNPSQNNNITFNIDDQQTPHNLDFTFFDDIKKKMEGNRNCLHWQHVSRFNQGKNRL